MGILKREGKEYWREKNSKKKRKGDGRVVLNKWNGLCERK